MREGGGGREREREIKSEERGVRSKIVEDASDDTVINK